MEPDFESMQRDTFITSGVLQELYNEKMQTDPLFKMQGKIRLALLNDMPEDTIIEHMGPSADQIPDEAARDAISGMLEARIFEFKDRLIKSGELVPWDI